jgi:hypothetical protein
MSVNLTTSPYYDDFDVTKNFYRILFKPGVPVQARELTQLQSIIQQQIKSFAGHIFVDGTRASKEDPSAITITNDKHKSLKLTGLSVANISNYLGKYVTGATSNTYGKVEFTFNADSPTIGDPYTVVFRPIKGTGEFLSGETLYFYSDIDSAEIKSNIYVGTETLVSDLLISTTGTTDEYSETINALVSSASLTVGDELYAVDGIIVSPLYVVEVVSATTIRLNENIGITGTNTGLQFRRRGSSTTGVLHASAGIYYKNGFFINVAEQSVVPQKYAPYPDKKSVIYRYDESAVNYNDDSSLLDPAFGSSNYLAPGADRLKITLTLDTVDLDSYLKADVTDNFIELARFIDGKTLLNYSAVDTTYSALSDKLAERTYDESGNYSIEPFRLTPAGTTTSGTNNRFFVSKGKAYIGGYQIKTSDKTELLVPKAREFETLLETDVNTYFGKYTLINSPYFGLYDPQQFTLKYYWECHNTTDRLAMNGTTLIGYVSPKFIKYESGLSDNAIYKFYWFNYEHVSTTANVDSVRSIISVQNSYSVLGGNDGTYANPLFFANIASGAIVDNKIKFYEGEKPSRYIFPINKSYVKDVTNINTVYQKLYSNVSMTGGVATITTSSPNKFVGTGGTTLSNYFSQQYYTVVVKEKIDTTTGIPHYFTGTYVDSTALSFDLDANKTNMTITYANSSVIAKLDIVATLQNNEETIRTKTLVQNAPLLANIISTGWVNLLVPDITALKAVYKFNTPAYPTDWAGQYTSGNTYATGKIVTNDDKAYRALVTTNEGLSNTNSWARITPEPLLLYSLDDGQRDFVYDWGRIKYLGHDAANVGYIVAVVDYFTHAGGTGPFTVNSYANTLYATIPTYRSIEDATTFNLRDCLDFRPARIAYDPGVGDSFTTTIVSRPDPFNVPGTQVDLSYYLPRIDRVYVQTTDVNTRQIGNKFRLDMGTSAVTPKAPADKSDRTQQLIATLVSPPYTAAASDVKVKYTDYSRYTMKNIGGLDSRLTALEKRVKRQGIDIAALNNKVFDRAGIQGNVLYTTGIFVEDFSNHAAALTTSPYFTATINTVKKECRPAFSAIQHKLFFIADPDVSYRDDLITMNYDEQTLTSQLVPTGFTQVNPSGTLQSSGSSSLFPLALAGAGYYAWATTTTTAAASSVTTIVTDEAAKSLTGVIDITSVDAGAFVGPTKGGALPDIFEEYLTGETAVELGVASTVGGIGTAGALDVLGVAIAEDSIIGTIISWLFSFSDERLKENINKVGEVDGLNVYTFNYKWDKTKQYSGVMAKELLDTKYADSVKIHKSGYYMVDYGKYETLRNIKGI